MTKSMNQPTDALARLGGSQGRAIGISLLRLFCLLAVCVAPASYAWNIAQPPYVEKSFDPPVIYAHGISQMTIRLTNHNGWDITDAQFDDAYPTGMANAPSGVVVRNTCGGMLTADPNGTSAALLGGTIPGSGACEVALNVTNMDFPSPPPGGVMTNHTGPVTSTNVPAGSDATADLTQVLNTLMSAPVVTMTLLPDTVLVGGQSVIEIAFANPNLVDITGVQFAMDYAGHIMNSNSGVATTGIVLNTCTTFEHVHAVPGETSLSMSGGTIPGGGFCILGIEVSGASEGSTDLHTGPVLSANANPGADAAATMTVASGSLLPEFSINKAFSPASVEVGGTSQMTISFVNNDPDNAVTGLQIGDVYPFGIANAPSGALVRNTCGGIPTLRAQNPDYDIYLIDGTIPAAGNCSIVINVVGTDQSSVFNLTGSPIGANALGMDVGAASMVVNSGALLDVPTAINSFAPTTVAVGETSQMTITLKNMGNPFQITGAQFSDHYPDGIANAPNDIVVSNTCGGTITADPGGDFFALANGTVPGVSSCSVVVNVIGKSAGQWVNQTGPIPSANAQTGASAIAGLTVEGGADITAPTVSKAFSPSSISVGVVSQMTISLTNNAQSTAITGVQFTDPYPGGMANTATGVVVAENTCGGTVTAPQGGASISLADGTIPGGGACDVVINVKGTVPGNWLNQTTPVTSTNAHPSAGASASLQVAGSGASPDLTITKTHAGNFTRGQPGATYSLTVHNIGAAPTTGLVTVSDALPAGLTATAMGGPGWSCDLPSKSCTRSDQLSPGSYPAITLTVDVSAAAPSLVTNAASVAGGGETNTTNNDANDPTTIGGASAAADLTLTKSHAGNFSQGQFDATYSLIAHNIGGAPTNGTVTVTDALPPSLTATAMSGPGWACDLQSTTCTRSDALATGASYPAITIALDVSNAAPPSVTNNATVSGGGETNTANDAASDATTIDPKSAGPDPTLTKSHAGNFSQGQTAATYSLIVHNVGGAPTNGAVTVSDTLPASLTSPVMSGPGWTCATTSCTRSDALDPGASYPAITLTVNVAGGAPSSITNNATVNGGGETDINNDSAADPTTIDAASAGADLTLTKAHAGNFSQGQSGAAYLLTVHNVGGAFTNGLVTVTDTLPPALTASGMGGSGWSCNVNTVSCTRSDALANGMSYQPITLIVSVAANAPPGVTNNATVGGGGETNTNNDIASDPTSVQSTGGGNHAPVAVGDAIEVAPNDTVSDLVGDAHAVDSVLDNDIDFDADALMAIKLSDPTHGFLQQFNSDGTFVYQNTASAATDTFTYKACDLFACSPPTTVTITIGTGLNDHLPFATDDAIQVAPGMATGSLVGDSKATDSVLDNDIDPDGDALSASRLTNPSHGDLTFNTDGSFSYQNHQNDNATTDNFAYSVCDTHGACDLGIVSITIGNGPTDHRPIVVDDAIQVAPGQSADMLIGDPNDPGSVLDNDSDPDVGDTLSAVKVGPLYNSSGNVSLNADGTFTYQNTDPQATTDTLFYEACDSIYACAAGIVTISINNNPPDVAPIAADDAIIAAPHGSTGMLIGGGSNVLTNDVDPGDTLTAHLISAPANGHVTLNVDGTFTYYNDDPAPGLDQWLYEACDSYGACSGATVSVTIDGSVPTVTCTLPRQVEVVGDTVNIDLSLLFAPPPGQSLIYGATNAPPSLSIIGTLLSGTLQANDASGLPYGATLTATTTGTGLGASENVTFQVLPTGEVLLRNGFDGAASAQPCQ